jgi:HD-GYP domain-containing protein (c-di-GMP phosphodiesterase class II)
MNETLEVMNTSAGAIWLYEPESSTLRCVVSRGWFTYLSQRPKGSAEGIGGIVFTTGKPYYTIDFAHDENSRPSIRKQIPEGWGGACIPIYTTTERVGIFYLGVPSDRMLKEEEKHLLSNLAEIAGNAIYRMRLHAQSEMHVQRLNALHNFDLAISSSLDLRLTLDDLLNQVTTQTGVDAADVLLLNEYSQTLEYAAGRGLRGSSAKRARLRMGDGFAGKASLERSIVAIPDLSRVTLSLTQGLLWQGEDFQAYFCVPMIAKGKIEGVLEVFHRSPLSPDLEWMDFLETLANRAAIAIMVSQLFENIQRSNAELRHAYDATIEGWSRALELRDRETKDHVSRVVDLTIELAREMRIFTEEELVHLRRGALLHDIGKMAVPDAILRKPGRLTEDEWKLMRMHPQHALEMLSPIPYLNRSLDIPYCHHEKWDGTGYPQGLKGEQIPLPARIFAAIDVWDALTNDRVYAKAWEPDRVIQYIKDQSGKQFDPQVVQAFMRCYQDGRIGIIR